MASRFLLGILLPFVLFAPLLSIGAEEQPDVRIFENPGGEEQPVSGRFVPLEKFEGSAKLSNAYASEGLSDFLNKLFLGAVSLGAILAVLRLAWAGFQYMGNDLWSSKQHAKEVMQETLLGLFILLGISLILNQINPDILKLNVGISKLPPAPPAVDAGTAAGLKMQQQYVDDTTTSPTDYTRSVSQTPIPGYYCYPSRTAPGSYGCLTNQANCNTLARSENATCTLTPNGASPPTTVSSLSSPRDRAIESTGAECIVISTETGECTTWKYKSPEDTGPGRTLDPQEEQCAAGGGGSECFQ